MARQFVFFYLMKNSPERIRSAIPLHVGHWKNRQLKGYRGGPFSDRSGGLIIFDAADLTSATELVAADPFVTQDLVEQKWIKEWLAE